MNMSPSVRKVWIEMVNIDYNYCQAMSPSVRKVWIEIKMLNNYVIEYQVTFREEGVD